MKCPHCLVEMHPKEHKSYLNGDAEADSWLLTHAICPACEKSTFSLERLFNTGAVPKPVAPGPHKWRLWPRGSSRPPPPQEVPKEIAQYYLEACAVLSDSPTASAALSRRCLQQVLRDAGKVKPQDLSKEIQEVLYRKTMPTQIADAIDSIRNVGNLAAHPMKDTATGAILPVEPGEAEWNLDVLESLFDFYYVQPAKLAANKAALNAKLKAAEKPLLKWVPFR